MYAEFAVLSLRTFAITPRANFLTGPAFIIILVQSQSASARENLFFIVQGTVLVEFLNQLLSFLAYVLVLTAIISLLRITLESSYLHKDE